MLVVRALLIWLLLMAVESIHGTLSALLLTPALGDLTARRLGVLTGAVLLFLVTLATIRWLCARRTGQLLGIGLLWVALTVTFEIALGLLFMLFAPYVAARSRKIRIEGAGKPGSSSTLPQPPAA